VVVLMDCMSPAFTDHTRGRHARRRSFPHPSLPSFTTTTHECQFTTTKYTYTKRCRPHKAPRRSHVTATFAHPFLLSFIIPVRSTTGEQHSSCLRRPSPPGISLGALSRPTSPPLHLLLYVQSFVEGLGPLAQLCTHHRLLRTEAR